MKHGEFVIPAGISISNDIIYVADSNNMRVQVFRYIKSPQPGGNGSERGK